VGLAGFAQNYGTACIVHGEGAIHLIYVAPSLFTHGLEKKKLPRIFANSTALSSD